MIAISFAILEQSRVILSFVFAGQARRMLCIVNCINYAPTQMIDGTEKPIRSLQTRSAIRRIWLYIKLPQKIPKSKTLNPPKSFDPGHLKSGVPPPPELKLQKVLKSSYSYCELEE